MARPSVVEDRRREILEATCDVVADRGFRDLRVADVAKIAQCSSGTIHYYFDSKDELLREAFRFEYEKSRERRAEALNDEDDPVTRLRKLAAGYLPSTPESVRSWRVWLELWVSAVRDPSMSRINDEYYNEWREAVLDAANEGHSMGMLSVSDSLLFANTYVSMMDGLAIQVLVGAQSMDVERMRATCRAFVDEFAV
ncbi:TetR/AcrR family transcriptional regulator [Aeromicrobium sp.]|uniref:TetR/AcrR family transcriptional regulator n=1 Tax=Aeromicrobium sp. TaxID=1871063 RepID=UPI0028A604D5|nr:TetR/AcrR family transcriptional regulator [Aeromicrobium sp.]